MLSCHKFLSLMLILDALIGEYSLLWQDEYLNTDKIGVSRCRILLL